MGEISNRNCLIPQDFHLLLIFDKMKTLKKKKSHETTKIDELQINYIHTSYNFPNEWKKFPGQDSKYEPLA